MRLRGLIEGQNPIDLRSELPGLHPVIDVLGRLALNLRGCIEHRKSQHRTAFDIERTDREFRPRIATGHDDHPTVRGHGSDT